MAQLTRNALLHSSSVSIFQGSFGSLSVAIKDQIHPSLQTANDVISEAMTQLKLDHPNICKAYDCFLASSPTGGIMSVFVMELCQTDVETAMHQQQASNEYWSEAELLNWLYTLSDALRYAQQMGVSHRNIQPHHILLASGQPKLCDFSASAKNLSTAWMSTTLAGTPAYLSPEICAQMGSEQMAYDSFKADVWALGVTFVMIARRDVGVQGVEEAVEGLNYAHLKTVLRAMLQRDPQARPSFADVMTLCQTAASALYQRTLPVPQCTKLCFMCKSAVPPNWVEKLPADLEHLRIMCKDLCSLKCTRHVFIQAQSDQHVKCSGCDEQVSTAGLTGPTVVSRQCGHPFHDKSCLERSVWQQLECPVCKCLCEPAEIEAILGPEALAPLEASRCSLCHLHRASQIYGICKHQLCSECDGTFFLKLWGSNCRVCNESG